MNVARRGIMLGLALVVAGTVTAADNGATGTKSGRRRGGEDGIFAAVAKLDLTAEQKAKVADLKKEYGPKMEAARKNAGEVLSDQQKKDRDAAMKAAKDAGKSRKEIFQAGEAAAKVTSEQKAKLAEVRKVGGALRKEVAEKVRAILTSDQQSQLKQLIGPRGGVRQGARRNGEQSSAGSLRGLLPGVGKLDLTSDQQAKIADLQKQYSPKLEALRKELREKVLDILTPEQKEKIKQAVGHHRRDKGTPLPAASTPES